MRIVNVQNYILIKNEKKRIHPIFLIADAVMFAQFISDKSDESVSFFIELSLSIHTDRTSFPSSAISHHFGHRHGNLAVLLRMLPILPVEA